MISTYGRVWHRYLHKYLSQGINGAGYNYIMMSTSEGPKPIQIHRIMMIVFNPVMNYETLDVNHRNGIKSDNYIWNLEWATRQENIIHAYNHNLMHKGELHPTAKMTEEDVKKIIELLPKVGDSKQLTSKQIIEIVGNSNISEKMVDDIRKKSSWSYLTENINFVQRTHRLFDESEVYQLCNYFETTYRNNLTINDHCRNALISIGRTPDSNLVDTVRKIYNKKYYPNINFL